MAGASIFLAVAQIDVRRAERADLGEEAERLRQGDFELGGGKAARIGDDLDVDVVADVEAGGDRGAAAGGLVGAEDAQAIEPGRRAQLAERVEPAAAAAQGVERRR